MKRVVPALTPFVILGSVLYLHLTIIISVLQIKKMSTLVGCCDSSIRDFCNALECVGT